MSKSVDKAVDNFFHNVKNGSGSTIYFFPGGDKGKREKCLAGFLVRFRGMGFYTGFPLGAR